MKQNKYDHEKFFAQYSQMNRSIYGLNGAGEWQTLRYILPNLKGKRILDLGCGYGWHCKYAIEQGADEVIGIDLSEKMLEKAKEINGDARITYLVNSVEDFNYQTNGKFDIVFSSLTFHYIASFEKICENVALCLKQGGDFIFSVEHPIFTSEGSQQWYMDENKQILHWPVDHYFNQGPRNANFLGEEVIKYHKTLTTYVNSLIKAGFEISHLIEPQPDQEFLENVEEMKEELRRPMMLILGSKLK